MGMVEEVNKTHHTDFYTRLTSGALPLPVQEVMM